MKILMKTKEKFVFVEDMDISLANALRRACSEIPLPAIDEAEFYKNDSVLNDQMLAHRLGLVPLRYEKLSLPDECSCNGKGCAKCTIQLKFRGEGPGVVYAKDLKGKGEMVYEEMPLVYLADKQELEFVAFVRAGRGIHHAKFSPGLVYYRHVFFLGGKIEEIKNIVDKYHPLFFEKTEKGFLVDVPEQCLDELEKESIAVEPASSLIFVIESFGQMDAKDIFLESMEHLREQLQVFAER